MHVDLELLKQTLDEHAIVSVTNSDGGIVYANQQFSKVSGYTLSELQGKNHRILKSGIHPPSYYRDMWGVLKRGETWHGNMCNRRKDGEHYWVKASIKPILDENNLPVQYISIRTVITEIKNVKERLADANAKLEAYRQVAENEFEMARELIEHMNNKSSANLDHVACWLQTATTLCGDLVLTKSYNNERTYILLADAMGHGLPAALALIPIAPIFSEMSSQGMSVSSILDEINARMTDCLPVGNFVAMTILSIDHENKLIELWNGGNPSGLLINDSGDVIKKFSSCHPAIGILRGAEFDSSPELFHWQNECCLTLYSDGVSEAQNADGIAFGEARIIEALRSEHPHQSLQAAVLRHLGTCKASDDISTASIALHG